MPDHMPVAILRTYEGLYDTGRTEPDPLGLFDPREDFMTKGLVVRDKGSFREFIDRIPERKMDFVPNPPPSDDPLLQRPEIDFENQMVLVLLSHDPNHFIRPKIHDVEFTTESMSVHCGYDEPSPVVAKVIAYGSYLAVVVQRFEGKVLFIPK